MGVQSPKLFSENNHSVIFTANIQKCPKTCNTWVGGGPESQTNTWNFVRKISHFFKKIKCSKQPKKQNKLNFHFSLSGVLNVRGGWVGSDVWYKVLKKTFFFTPSLRDMITNQQKVKYGLLCQIQKVMVFAWMCTLQSVNIENSKNFQNLKKFNNLISVEIKVCSCTRIYLKGGNQFPIRRVAPLLSKIWAKNVSCWCPKK